MRLANVTLSQITSLAGVAGVLASMMAPILHGGSAIVNKAFIRT